MRKRTVVFLCLFSALLGSIFTLGTQFLFSTNREKTLTEQNRPQPYLTKTNPNLTNSPDAENFESLFFSNFFGEDRFSQMLGTEVSQRSDENYIYFELPLKETEQSKIKTNLVDEYIEISGEITERKNSSQNGESILQRNFSQTLPLPKEANPSTLQIISEPNKTVIRFEKWKNK